MRIRGQAILRRVCDEHRVAPDDIVGPRGPHWMAGIKRIAIRRMKDEARLSSRQIAKVMGLRPSTVRRHLQTTAPRSPRRA